MTGNLNRFWNRLIAVCILLWIVVLAIAGYAELINEGKVAPPSPEAFQQFFQRLGIVGGNTMLMLIAVAVAIIVIAAAVAPILFALRSGDVLTVLISVVLVTLTWAAVIFSRTVIDLAVAGIIYLSSTVLSVIVYAAEKISGSIDRMPRQKGELRRN